MSADVATGELVPYNDVVLLMEFAHHGNLVQRLRRCGGRMPEVQAVTDVLRPLLDALAYLHAKGIVHRDVKPGRQGRGRVGDAGGTPCNHVHLVGVCVLNWVDGFEYRKSVKCKGMAVAGSKPGSAAMLGANRRWAHDRRQLDKPWSFVHMPSL